MKQSPKNKRAAEGTPSRRGARPQSAGSSSGEARRSGASAKTRRDNGTKPARAGAKPRREDGPRPTRAGAKPRREDAPRPTRAGAKPRREDGPRPTRAGAKPRREDGPRPIRTGAGAGRDERAKPGRGGAKPQRDAGAKPARAGAKPTGRRDRGLGDKPRDKPRDAGPVKRGRREAYEPRARVSTKPNAQRFEAKPPARRYFEDPDEAQARSEAGKFGSRAEPRASTPKPRVHSPEIAKPVALTSVGAEPHPGMWLFTTREGSEQDLVDELLLAKVIEPGPRVLGPALVLSPKLPRREGRPMELTFARQGFEIVQSVKSHDLDEVTQRIARSLRNQLAQAENYALQVWVPDSTTGNPLSSLADELDQRVERALAQSLPNLHRVDDGTLRRLGSVLLAQVAVIDTERFAAGVMYGNRSPSMAKGGRTRMRLQGHLPSRAARKLEEALAWIGVAPGPGEICVDLGAAPGGWTYVLAERRARVIAVDPAKLRPDIAARKSVRHVQESAFTFEPDEHIDWLFCDMAWRPLEAAALLAKWGRKRWARILVANIKLPMTKKVEILARVKKILELEGEWKHVRAKQLYHDRDEITLTALK